LSEACQGAALHAELWYEAVPILPCVEEYIAQGALPGGTSRNPASYGHLLGAMPAAWRSLLCAPQTSGVLLLAVGPAAGARG
ncbi:selenide, water dikinase SelD, partial [Cronobacter sakazakii]